MAVVSLMQEIDAPPAILNALADPVFVVGADNEITYLNLAAEQFFQASAAALVGTALSASIPADSPVFALIDKVRATGNSMSQYDVLIETPRIDRHAAAALDRRADRPLAHPSRCGPLGQRHGAHAGA